MASQTLGAACALHGPRDSLPRHFYPVVIRTFTSRLSDILGTQKKKGALFAGALFVPKFGGQVRS